jgi:hypothetical protein
MIRAATYGSTSIDAITKVSVQRSLRASNINQFQASYYISPPFFLQELKRVLVEFNDTSGEFISKVCYITTAKKTKKNNK